MPTLTESKTENIGVCFAVTDQHVIIPLNIIEKKEIDGCFKIETEIACEPTGHSSSHHKAYFKSMWCNSHYLRDNQGVFEHKDDAITHALSNARDDLRIKQTEIERLNEKILNLKSKI
jgi:hypothetical protein